MSEREGPTSFNFLVSHYTVLRSLPFSGKLLLW
jgi:hypothetical protein